MVGPREAALTHLAFEGLGPRVLAVVSRQLVGPGEAPLARIPCAPVAGKNKQKKVQLLKLQL